ncbi:MAG: ABC transporter permease subunit [Acidimicrobiales bacterium]
MSDHLNFMLLGLGNGAVFAALAVALVMFYRSSGVLNFASGAIALHAAYTYAFLRNGRFLVSIPFLPKTIDLGDGWSFWPAFLVTVVQEMLIGLVLYGAVFRPLRNRTPLAKAVGSIGVMGMMTSLVAHQAGSNQVLPKPVFPRTTYSFGDIRFLGDRVWFAVTIVAIAAAVGALYRFTRFGLRTRASSESEVGAFVSGLSPERIAMANWALGAGVAAVAGVLIAPLTPLLPGTYTLFIVPALAAAVIGRFTMLLPAVFAGLAIGMLQSETVHLQAAYSWFPRNGVSELIPLVIVLVVLVVRGRPLPTRGALVQSNLAAAPRPRSLVVPLAVFVPIAMVAIFAFDGSRRAAVFTTFVAAIFGLSLVVITGYVGQISLAQLSIGGVAGFLLGTMTTDWGIPFPVAPLLAATGAAVVGTVIGLPALRIRGMLVAVVTLMLATALEALWFRNPSLTGGLGGNAVEPPRIFGLDLGIGAGASYPRPAFGLLCLVCLVAVGVGIARLRVSRLGSAMLAVRANERAAAAAGIDVVRTKLLGFAIASFIAGIAGALLAYKQTTVTWESYSALGGLQLFTLAYIAGVESIGGGIATGVIAAGGIFYVTLDRAVELGSWYGLVSGLGLILTVIKNPEGIAGALSDAGRRLAGRLLPHRTASVPASGAPGLVSSVGPVAEAGTSPVDWSAAPAILRASGLTVQYDGVKALTDVDVDLSEGAIVGLIGPNGAGKTTFMDALSGLATAGGTVTFAGESLDGLAPHRRARRGIARTFQGLDLYDELTVHENVLIGLSLWSASRSSVTAGEHVAGVLDRVGLAAMRDRNVKELSRGQRQLVSIARALAGCPTLLLLDEPAAGLDSRESVWLADQLRIVRDSGVTILLVDHDMSLVLELCDVIYVLDFGVLIAAGSPAEVRADPNVARAYLGESHLDEVPA